MKKTQEILGLPIISISDGMEVGRVKSIIINADKGAIDYIVVDSGIQILSARVIPTERILGIGEYALTIENDGSINDISKIPAAINLLQENIQVKGTKVLTKKGRLIGEIGDFFVDEDECCRITGLEYIADITQKRVRVIPRESVITFGKNLLVVTEDVESKLLENAAQLGSGDRGPGFEKKNLMNTPSNDIVSELRLGLEHPSSEAAVAQADKIIAEEGTSLFNEARITPESVNVLTSLTESLSSSLGEPDAIDSIIPQPEGEEASIYGGGFLESEPADAQPEQPAQAPVEENSAANLFEQRQRQYLNGRRSTKTITDNSGNIIVNEGMVITDEIIDQAKSSGKLIELVMNNKA
ncbi:MAG: PRC-barrel domain-containing protein [Clostridia bacterium]|nr:PRC-barrel domain-containing protein [Clostridia bacterium]